MAMPSEQQMLTAISQRDSIYDGRFVYGVITTGVFCKPSCKSRQARVENIRCYADAQSAMQAGFRPCKRCKPKNMDPEFKKYESIARYIVAHANEKLTLNELAKQAGLSPSRFQRVFKSVFGISPKALQDSVRMNQFKTSLKKGDDVTDAIFAAGYGSISRVYGEQLRNIGMTPKAYRSGAEGETIAYAFRVTALGPLMMAATRRGVCFVEFGDQRQQLLERLQNEFPRAHIIASPSLQTDELDAWMDALDAHISESKPRPDLPLDLRGTAFQVKVWRFLLSVSEGEVISYAELARKIDKPKAVRAVASACAANRIGLLIPCHRVLRGDGGLGGYRWGLERKRALLDAERSKKIDR